MDDGHDTKMKFQGLVKNSDCYLKIKTDSIYYNGKKGYGELQKIN